MKIFMLADKMNIGGAETHIYELSRLLARRGHEVIVFSEGGDVADRLRAVGVRHEHLTDALSSGVTARLAERIRRERPHVIHAHTRRRGFLCRLLQRTMDLPVVFTAHALFSPRFPLNRLSYFPKDVVAVSADVAEHLVRHFGVPGENITIIANGVNTHRFHAAPRSEPHPFTILSVSRLDKNSSIVPTLLCRLAPRLTETLGTPVRILIAGGGNALPSLLASAQRANAACGRQTVSFLGAVSDTAPLYRAADLFVGVSRSAMEAMASECPVILCGNEGYLGIPDGDILRRAESTNLCGRGETYPTENLLLRDILALASRTPEERAAMGSTLRDTVLSHHSADRMMEETLAVYQKAHRRFCEGRQTDALICGYYGYGNCGDELILRCILAGQTARANHLRIGVMTADGTAPEGTVGIKRYHPGQVLRALRKSGTLILGGGSLLQDATSRRSLSYYLTLIDEAKKRGLAVMLYANGIGPLSDSALIRCRRVLAKVDVISLRDTESYRKIRAMHLPHVKVVQGADPVLMSPSVRDTSRPTAPRLSLFPRGGKTGKEETLFCDGVAHLASSLGLDVTVIPMHQKEDGDAAERMAHHIAKTLSGSPHSVEARSLSPEETETWIADSALVVSERLHALILAFREGVPSVGIARDPKIGAFLREIGCPDTIVARPTPDTLRSAAEASLRHPPDPALLSALRRRAEADADCALCLITRTVFRP